jgi:hypothetical protein
MTTEKPKLRINKLRIAAKLYEKYLLESCIVQNILSTKEIAERINQVESFISWCSEDK